MMDLSEYRTKIDEIDRQLVALFTERMATAADIAAYKRRIICRFWTQRANSRSSARLRSWRPPPFRTRRKRSTGCC